MSPIETSEVVIIGCGPTGAVLSAYLARQGVRNIVLERESSISSDPRGIALDEDGIRILQSLGLYDKIYTEIGQRKSWDLTKRWRSFGAKSDWTMLISWY